MNRNLLLLIALFSFSSLRAQLGPANPVTVSDIPYLTNIVTGDVYLSGNIDIIATTNYTRNAVYFKNLGNGVFKSPQIIITEPNGFSNGLLELIDFDQDGDKDFMTESTWYRNDGQGQQFVSMGNFIPANYRLRLMKDIDGDGDFDGIAYKMNTNIVLLMNDGTGNLLVTDTLGPAGNCNSVTLTLTRVNGDQIEDLIIGGDNVQTGLYIGLGSGQFSQPVSIPMFNAPAFQLLADVDNDGDNDLFTFKNSNNSELLFLNDSNGNFILTDTLGYNYYPIPLAGDFDGDNDLDITNANTSNHISILLNNLPLNWDLDTIDQVGVAAGGPTVPCYAKGDLDNDGDEDLIAGSAVDFLNWYPNNGSGTIGGGKTVCNYIGRATGEVADFDLDGDNDVVSFSYIGQFLTIHLNDNSGNFTSARIEENFSSPANLRAADLNGDNRPDLTTASREKSILWNLPSGWQPDVLLDSLIPFLPVDVDNDGDYDLICRYAVLLNDGNGNFNTIVDSQLLVTNVIDTTDLNGDGYIDFVTAGGNSILTCLNNGNGTFNKYISNSISVYTKIILSDINGDNIKDLYCIGYSNATLYLYDGNGFFSYYSTLYFPGFVQELILYDLDYDGIQDLIYNCHQVNWGIYLQRGAGSGLFGPTELLETEDAMFEYIFSDINNDLKPDFISFRIRSIWWQENFSASAYQVRGSVFKDINSDGQHNFVEPKIPYQLVRTDANNLLVWTNNFGDYRIPVDSGVVNVWTIPAPSYIQTTSPDTLVASPGLQNPIVNGINFGMDQAFSDNSAFLSLTPSGTFRCNSTVGLWVNVQNQGTYIPNNAILKLDVHPDVLINSFSVQPDSINGHTYYWNIDSLGWFQAWQNQVFLYFGPAGSNSLITAYVYWEDSLTESYSESIGGIVSCAIDPNDKHVSPQGYGSQGAVLLDTDNFTYTVNFQNTGNDTAYLVVIKDVLDPDLDWSSLQIISTSHPLTGIRVNANGEAEFRFDGILLPDSNINEPGSHGYIKYRLNKHDSLSAGTSIVNTANIYFDLNQPVATNTVINTLVVCGQTPHFVYNTGTDTLYSTSGDAYQWLLNGVSLPGETNQLIKAINPGNYSVIVTSVIGCIDTSTTFTYPCTSNTTVNATSTQLCEGSGATSIISANQLFETYLWYKDGVSTGNSDTVFTVTLPGIYSALVSVNGCFVMTDSIQITYYTFPLLSVISQGTVNVDTVSGSYIFCDTASNNSILIEVQLPYSNNFTWYNNGIPIQGATGNTLVVSQQGAYTVSASTALCPDNYDTLANPVVILVKTPVNPTITWNGSGLSASPSWLTNWQWQLNGQDIPGATDSLYTPLQNGLYSVVARDSFCSVSSLTPYNFTSVGLQTISDNPIKVYPNPANRILKIESTSIITSIELSDLSGRIILIKEVNATNSVIESSELDPGIYTLSINGKYFRKIVPVLIEK